MTACSRRNFVSGMGALILMTGTSVTSLAKEEKADKPKRYAMVHDETACIGCTACMDACRETNHVPEGVSRLEILRSEPYGEFPNQEYEFFRQSCQHCTNAPCVAVCPTGASFIDPETDVAPFAGAWIEMRRKRQYETALWSLPSREHGLKL